MDCGIGRRKVPAQLAAFPDLLNREIKLSSFIDIKRPADIIRHKDCVIVVVSKDEHKKRLAVFCVGQFCDVVSLNAGFVAVVHTNEKTPAIT